MNRRPLPPSLTTNRLLIRPIEESDLDFFIELHGDPRVTRFLGGDGSPRTPEVVREWLPTMRRWYAEHGLGPFAVVRRDDGRPIGRGGLTIFEVEHAPSTEDGVPLATWGLGSAPADTHVDRNLEIGYVIHPDAWGQGYATEVARAWMQYAFDVANEPQIASLIHPDNVGSVRVAQKNGLSPTVLWRLEGRDYRVYTMTREQWQSSQSKTASL